MPKPWLPTSLTVYKRGIFQYANDSTLQCTEVDSLLHLTKLYYALCEIALACMKDCYESEDQKRWMKEAR